MTIDVSIESGYGARRLYAYEYIKLYVVYNTHFSQDLGTNRGILTTVDERNDTFFGKILRLVAGTAIALPQLAFFLLGLIQLFAVWDEIHSVTHLWKFISFLLACIVTYMPIVGSICGFFGAKDVWGWSWWQAAVLYIGLPVLMLMISVVIAAIASSVNKSK
jgi:hypothetical protein